MVLFGGKGEADGFALDFAGPLIVRAAGPWAAILDMAFADPTGVGEGLGEFFKALAALGGRRNFGHKKEDSWRVNRAVYIPPYTPFLPCASALLVSPPGNLNSRPGARRGLRFVRALRTATLAQIEERLAAALPRALLAQRLTQDYSRARIFTLHRTVWCWIWQILQGHTSCREVVRQ